MPTDDSTPESPTDDPTGTERLVLFTDAVAAIAITLLVLPLVELFGESGIQEEPLGGVLAEHAAALGALLLGFVLIARFWWAHHQLFRKIARVSGSLMRWNFVWILAVVLLPVTTQVITAWPPSSGTVALYSTTLVLASGALTAMAVVAGRNPELLVPGTSVRQEVVGIGVTAGLLAVAFAVGTVFPHTVNYFAYLLLFLAGPVEHLVRRRSPALVEP